MPKILGNGAFGTVVTNKNGPNNNPTNVVKFFKNKTQRQTEITQTKKIFNLTHNGRYLMNSIDLIPEDYPNSINTSTPFYGAKMPYLGIDIINYLNDREHTIPIEILYPQFRDILGLTLKFSNTGMCHRDIRLENMLIDPKSGRLTLIDFGFYNTCKNTYTRHYPSGNKSYFTPPENVLIRIDGGILKLVDEQFMDNLTKVYTGVHYSSYIDYYIYKKISEDQLYTFLKENNSKNLSYIKEIILTKLKDGLKIKLLGFELNRLVAEEDRDVVKELLESNNTFIDKCTTLTELITQLTKKSDENPLFTIKDLYLSPDYSIVEGIITGKIINDIISETISNILFPTWDNFGVGMMFLELLCNKYRERLASLILDQKFIRTFQLLERMIDYQLETRITPNDAFTEMDAICKMTSQGGRRRSTHRKKRTNRRKTRR